MISLGGVKETEKGCQDEREIILRKFGSHRVVEVDVRADCRKICLT